MGAAPSEGLPVKPKKSGELRQGAAPNYDIFSYPLHPQAQEGQDQESRGGFFKEFSNDQHSSLCLRNFVV